MVTNDNTTIVMADRNAGSGLLQGDTDILASNGLIVFSNLAHTVATNITIDFSADDLIGVTSSNITIKPAAAASLAFTAQPGDGAAGTFLSPSVTIQALDSFGNSVAGLPVSIALTTGTGALSGTTTRSTDTNGVATFNDLSINLAGTKKLTATSGALSTGESDPFVISAGAAHHLAVQTQPSAVATAGLPFASQPVIRIEDVYGNLCSSDNSTLVAAARGAGTGTLQGTTNVAAVNGLITFANLSHNVATTISMNFAASGLIGTNSSNVVVSPAAFARLQLLAPGEPAAPGPATGKPGAPAAQTAGAAFSVTANAVDNFWNLVSTNDLVAASLSDPNSTPPSNAALVNGSRSFSLTFRTVGDQTVTVSDVNTPSLLPDPSPVIPINAAALPKLQILLPGETAAPGSATGKTGSPAAQTAGTPIASGIIVRAVDANWNLVAGATPNI